LYPAAARAGGRLDPGVARTVKARHVGPRPHRALSDGGSSRRDAYIALFNYAFARKARRQVRAADRGYRCVRSTLESEQAILRALRWVGLEWDEGPDKGGPHGPYRQSERAEIYRKHAETLPPYGLLLHMHAPNG